MYNLYLLLTYYIWVIKMAKKQSSQNKNSHKSATDNQWSSSSMNNMDVERENQNKKSHK